MQNNEPISDDWYEALMNTHHGLSDAQSRRLDAALVLLLAHRIGDLAALRDCLHSARAAIAPQENA
jgi:hypothetical protein